MESTMPKIESFRDLDVYRLSMREARKQFLITSQFPREERYSLTDQVRRSSRAVSALLAEAWGRRRYIAAFSNKLNESLGEAMETRSMAGSRLCLRIHRPCTTYRVGCGLATNRCDAQPFDSKG